MSGQSRDGFAGPNPGRIATERLGSHTEVDGCAACGVVVIQPDEPLWVDTVRVRNAFAYGRDEQLPGTFSSRGVVDHGHTLRLIKALVRRSKTCNRREFRLCEDCMHKYEARGFDKEACSLDLGDASGLPELTLAEKASISMVRVYGHLIKVQMHTGDAPCKLSGHCISFAQDLRPAAGRVFPRTDVDQCINVQFIGGLEHWQGAIPLLRTGDRAPLKIRKDAVAQWLERLKQTHPLYQDIVIDARNFETLEDNVNSIIINAVMSTDRATRIVNMAMQDDIADNNAGQCGGDPAEQLLMSDVVVENQRGAYDERARVRENLATLGLANPPPAANAPLQIAASKVPLNEFEENSAIIGGAFPWVFMKGIRGRVDAKMRRIIVSQFDNRVAQEPTLLFLLFNQMQRHRATHNIARGSKEQLAVVEELRNTPGLEDKIADAASGAPSEEGNRLRRLVLTALHHAEVRIPFSRSEMDAAYVELLAILRFKASPTFFLTVSPSVVDNAFGLKVSFGAEGMHEEEYPIRSALVFQTPARSALFFKHMMEHIQEQVLVIDGSHPGVFGTVRAFSRTNECQGRTLLHAHMLLWTDVTPELVQQLYRKGKQAILDSIYAFMESVVTVRMPAEFHVWSKDLWDRRERAPNPGLEQETEVPLWCAVHKEQSHREHRPTCWYRYVGKEQDTDRCRMGFPAGLWTELTQLIRVTCDVNTGEVAPLLNPDPSTVPCTHVMDCDCKEYADLVAFAEDPVVVELCRPLVSDQIISSFTPSVLRQTWSNTSTAMLSTLEQAAVISLYMIKYNSKNKFNLANALAAIVAARKRMTQKTGETTERTFWNCFVNAASSDHEVPATMAAFALLGGRGFETSCSFWYVFPWDSVGIKPPEGQTMFDEEVEEEDAEEEDAAQGAEGEEEEEEEVFYDEDGLPVVFGRRRPKKSRDVPIIRAYQQEKFPTEGGECSGHRVFVVDKKPVAVTQEEIYLARPHVLENMSFLAFSCALDVEEKDEDTGRQTRSKRYDLLSTLSISTAYRLRVRTTMPIPILGGSAPPMLPQRNDTRRAKDQLHRWAKYWAVLLMPWRKREDLEAHTPESMLAWLQASLRLENGATEKERALFVINVSAKWRHIKRHCVILDAWRFRAADTRAVVEKRKQRRNAFGKGDEIAAETRTVDHAALLSTIFRYAATGGFEDEGMRMRIVQLASMFPTRQLSDSTGQALPPSGFRVPVVASAAAAEVAKAIAAFDEPIVNDERQGLSEDEGGAGPKQPHVILPDPSLNDGQNRLRYMVLNSIVEGKRELIFVQGEAGTGKSHVIRAIATEAAKLPGCGPNTVRCASPTGVAAENLLPGTMTIHRAFSIHPKNARASVEDLRGEAQTAFHQRFRGTRVFIIDEISMVSPLLLIKIELRLKELAEAERKRYAKAGNVPAARQINPDDWFGGFTVVVMGDFRQIPPVGSASLLKMSLDPRGPGAHGGFLWRKFKMLQLTEQCRASEPRQRARVEALRKGTITADLLNGIGKLTDEEAAGAFRNAVFLVKTNKERVAINDVLATKFAMDHGVPAIRWQNELGARLASIIDEDMLEDIVNMTPDLKSMFVPGAPAMILRNVNPQCGMSNGSCCEMVGLAGVSERDQGRIAHAPPGAIVTLEKPPTHVLVRVDALDSGSKLPRLMADDGSECVPLELETGEVEVGNERLTYRSHHVTLAFAVTMHKVQGQTRDLVVVCLANHTPKWKPTFEQLLVSFTRVRRADDLRLLPSLTLTDQNFSSLIGLEPNADVTEWFNGKFDPDGFRIYEEAVVKEPAAAKPQRKRKNDNAQEAQPATDQPVEAAPPKKKARREPPEDSFQTTANTNAAYDWLVARLPSDAPLRHIDVTLLSELLEQIGNAYAMIDVSTVEAVLARVNEPAFPYKGALDNWPEANTFVTVLPIGEHFIAQKIDMGARPPVITLADSLPQYTNNRLQEKREAIADTKNRMAARVGCAAEGIRLVEIQGLTQATNDCAVEAANSCLRMMFPAEQVPRLSRNDIIRAVQYLSWNESV